MTRIVPLKFQQAGRQYKFNAQSLELKAGDKVIVETDRGRAMAIVVIPPREVADNEVPEGLKTILPDILEIFQAFYRDVLMTLQGRGDEELVNLDLREKIHRVSAREDVSTILSKLEALIEVRRQLDRNVNRQLAMEVLLLKLSA